MHLLFICSRNQWRSRTAEDLFKNGEGISVRSAGTAASARIKVNEKLLDWADVIYCMETEHTKQLKQRFPEIMQAKKVIVLDIPDEYEYMDEELVGML